MTTNSTVSDSPGEKTYSRPASAKDSLASTTSPSRSLSPSAA